MQLRRQVLHERAIAGLDDFARLLRQDTEGEALRRLGGPGSQQQGDAEAPGRARSWSARLLQRQVVGTEQALQRVRPGQHAAFDHQRMQLLHGSVEARSGR